jgi:hypothetical protein
LLTWLWASPTLRLHRSSIQVAHAPSI